MIHVDAIDHINVTVADLEASIGFYNRVFGFRVAEDCRDDGRPYVILGRAGTAWLALHQQTGEQLPASGRINHWGFVVADFDTLHDRLQSMGIPVLYTERWRDGVVEYPHSRSVYVADPDGNEIELTSAFGGGLS